MREISEQQLALLTGTSFPGVRFVVEVIVDGQIYDITERKKSEISIIEACEYRENLVYRSEVPMSLDNSDGWLRNNEGNGLFDVEDDVLIECFIYGYLDHRTIDESQKLKLFGGWLDLTKIKENAFSKMDIDVVIMSYLGLGEKRSGARMCTRYLDNRGLIVYNVMVWVTRANIADKILKNGIHTLQTQLDGAVKQVRLDEGPWTTITNRWDPYILQNVDNSQQIEIRYYDEMEDPFIPDAEALIIVRNEREQYPYTNYYNANAFSLAKKAFSEIEVTDTLIEPFEIQTWDGRKVISIYEIPEVVNTDSQYYKVNAIVSDGNRYIWMGYRNKIIQRDMVTNEYSTLYSFPQGTDYFEIYRLDYSADDDLLFIWLWDGTDFYKRLYKMTVNTDSIIPPVLLFDNTTSTRKVYGNIHNNFHYVKSTKHFIFVYKAAYSGIAILDLNGNQTEVNVLQRPDQVGFNLLYEDTSGAEIVREFYALFGNSLSKLTYYPGGWSLENYVCAWHWGGDHNCIGKVFLSEKKIFIRKIFYGESVIFDKIDKSFSEVLNIDDYELTSPFEWSNKLYVVATDIINFVQKIGYITNDSLTLESENIWQYKFPASEEYNDQQRMCVTKNYKGYEVLNLIATKPNLLMRFSNWFVLYLEGEIDFTDKTIRDVLEELSSSFFAFMTVKYDRRGIFVDKNLYHSDSTVTLLKEFTADRVKETAYNELYDAVEVSNGESSGIWGNESIESVILSLSLSYVPSSLLKDFAKYFWEYYQDKRKIFTIKYPSGFIHVETLDQANLENYGIMGEELKIHKITINKDKTELQVLVK